MNIDQLIRAIRIYNETILFEQGMNKELTGKKIRRTNFPSHISENIAKFAYKHKYGDLPNWDIPKGDLELNGQALEVKGSINLLADGPPTFGPKEGWNRIYFVDGERTFEEVYTVYEIRLSNTDDDWKNILVNKTTTYQERCDEGKRPRINFTKLLAQLDDSHYEIIFSGSIEDLR